MDKKTLRKHLLNSRLAQLWTAQEARIAEHLKAYFRLHPFDSVGFYWPIKNEIDLRAMMRDLHLEGVVQQLALPRLDGKSMRFFVWDRETFLTPNAFGLVEPEATREIVPNCLLVPCVAMDREGHRLGYGGGYFDRYLEKYPHVMTVGVLAGDFLLESVPFESHDRLLDACVTEDGWVNNKKRRQP